MKGTKEFNERMLSDKAFASKFDNVVNYDQALALAKAEGYDLEQLSEEELDQVAGGDASTLISAITATAKQGLSEFKDIRNLLNSDAYKAMSNEERNKSLGKELANSWGLNVSFLGGVSYLTGGLPIIYTQIKWRTSGTSDTVRNALEKVLS